MLQLPAQTHKRAGRSWARAEETYERARACHAPRRRYEKGKVIRKILVFHFGVHWGIMLFTGVLLDREIYNYIPQSRARSEVRLHALTRRLPHTQKPRGTDAR